MINQEVFIEINVAKLDPHPHLKLKPRQLMTSIRMRVPARPLSVIQMTYAAGGLLSAASRKKVRKYSPYECSTYLLFHAFFIFTLLSGPVFSICF